MKFKFQSIKVFKVTFLIVVVIVRALRITTLNKQTVKYFLENYWKRKGKLQLIL